MTLPRSAMKTCDNPDCSEVHAVGRHGPPAELCPDCAREKKRRVNREFAARRRAEERAARTGESAPPRGNVA